MPSAPVTVSLSGGGYRAALFAAGSLLALSDSSLRSSVVSVSSVSGGSITSAMTVGGFEAPEPGDPDPMYSRVRRVGGLTRTKAIFTEELVSWGIFFWIWPLILLIVWFLFPQATNLDAASWTILALVLFAVPGFVVLSAIPQSLYGVQGAIECLTTQSVGEPDAATGPTLADVGNREKVSRVFCATDLAGGSHVYLSADRVLAPGLAGDQPNLLLADVVAASAGFPGFRPLVFSLNELGMGEQAHDEPQEPRPRHMLSRFLIGGVGILGVVAAAVAVVARIIGLLGGLFGLLAATAIVCAGSLAAWFCATRLIASGQMRLVDGGVYDNLGAAFALLTSDDRYPGLKDQLHLGAAERGVLLVVDASKEMEALDTERSEGFRALVPLRLRGASRAVFQLIGNANSVARKRTIAMLLARRTPFAGAVISIGDVPEGVDDQVDWDTVAVANAATKTTLDALPELTVRALILHGYRLTEAAIHDLGHTMDRRRAVEEFNDLAGSEARQEAVAAVMAEADGPYARRENRVRIASRAAYWGLVAGGMLLALGPLR